MGAMPVLAEHSCSPLLRPEALAILQDLANKIVGSGWCEMNPA